MILIYLIIGATAFVSYQAFEDKILYKKLLYNPYVVHKYKQYYRFLSHTLVHSDWSHLIFNMLTLYFFADTSYNYLNAYLGKGIFFFMLLYIAGAIVASLPSFFQHKNHSWYNAVGASGAVSAVLFSTIFFDPWVGIMLFLIPVPIPGFVFGLIYLVASSYMSKKGGDNIAHDAHIAGGVFGFIFPMLIKPELYQVFLNQLLS